MSTESRKRGKNLVESHKAAEKRRNLITAGVIGLIVVGIMGGAIWASQSKRDDATPRATELVEPSDVTDEYGIVLSPSVFAEDPEAVEDEDPSVAANIVIYEDFSCPACKSFEESANERLMDMVREGQADIEYRLVGFLDDLVAANEHSKRAASASLCVRDANGMEGWKTYHDWLYEDQPVEGAQGPTNVEFIEAAQDLDLVVDADCVKTEKYVPWMVEATDQFQEDEVNGTPTVLVNGKEIASDINLIEAAVEDANLQ